MADTSQHDIFDFKAVERQFETAKTPAELYKAIVNAPFHKRRDAAFIFLGIVVLLLVNDLDGTIDRVALSDTAEAAATKQVSAKRFEDIRIPLHAPDNLIAQVIDTQTPGGTTDWAHLFTPELTAAQARINQANGGIGYSAVHSVKGQSERGAIIFSFFDYPENINDSQRLFMEQYSRLVSRYLG